MSTTTASVERIQTVRDLVAFADQVVASLPGWAMETPDEGDNRGRGLSPRVVLRDAVGGTIIVVASSKFAIGADRVTIHASPPAHGYSHRVIQYTPVSITCAINRGPDAVAGDIARRVLPGYATMVRSVADQVAEEDALVRAEGVLAEVITGAIPGGQGHASSYRDYSYRVTERPVVDGLIRHCEAAVVRSCTHTPGMPSREVAAIDVTLRNLTGEQALRVLTAIHQG